MQNLQIVCQRSAAVSLRMMRFSRVLAAALGLGAQAAVTPRQESDALLALSDLNEQATAALQQDEATSWKRTTGCSLSTAAVRKDW